MDRVDFQQITDMQSSWQSSHVSQKLLQDIAYIYEILHCNHFVIAQNDEVAAVEDFIDEGNILEKSWIALCQTKGNWWVNSCQKKDCWVVTYQSSL